MPPAKRAPSKGKKAPAAGDSPAGRKAKGGASPSPSSRKSSKSEVASTNNYLGIGGKEAEYEFGGPWGVAALMLWSHYILFYFW